MRGLLVLLTRHFEGGDLDKTGWRIWNIGDTAVERIENGQSA